MIKMETGSAATLSSVATLSATMWLSKDCTKP